MTDRHRLQNHSFLNLIKNLFKDTKEYGITDHLFSSWLLLVPQHKCSEEISSFTCVSKCQGCPINEQPFFEPLWTIRELSLK